MEYGRPVGSITFREHDPPHHRARNRGDEVSVELSAGRASGIMCVRRRPKMSVISRLEYHPENVHVSTIERLAAVYGRRLYIAVMSADSARPSHQAADGL